MMKRLLSAAMAFVCAFGAVSARAQMMTVAGSSLSDATGAPISSATISFQPVTSAGVPLSFRKAGNGQSSKTAVTAAVTNGAFSIQLPNVAQTIPANVCFAVQVIDNQTGENLLGPGYGCVQPSTDSSQSYWCTSSSACNFDLYAPSTPALVPSTPGIPGQSASVVVGTVTSGSSASVTNSGTSTAAILNFVIPAGTNGVASLSQLATLRAKGPSTANLFNLATATSGYVDASTGAFTANFQTYYTSDYIPANSGGQMVGNFSTPNDKSGLAFFDQNLAFVSGLQVTSGTAFSVPNTAAFLRFSTNPQMSANTMLVNGSTLPGSFVSFQPAALSDAKAAAAASASAVAGAITYAQSLLLPQSSNLFDVSQIVANGALTCSGGVASGFSDIYTGPYIPVVPAQSYTMAKGYTNASNPSYGLVWFDYQKNVLSCVPIPYSDGTTFTAPAGAAFVRFLSTMGTQAQQMFTAGTSVPSTYVPFAQLPLTPAGVSSLAISATSPLAGKRWGASGDSYIDSYGGLWIPQMLAATGMTQTYQDAKGGRTLPQAFTCYFPSGTTIQPGVSTLGTYGTGNSCVGGSSNTVGNTAGNTLAQNLANVDYLSVDYGANDINDTVGNLGDPTTAGTYFGTLRWTVETILAAKPSIRLLLVTNSYIQSNPAGAQAIANATEAYGNSVGIPVLNLFKLSGINAQTVSTRTRDGLHWTDAAFGTSYALGLAAFYKANP